MKRVRTLLRGSYVFCLVSTAFWVLVWPPLADFDGNAPGARLGYLATLGVYLAVVAALCTLGVRGVRGHQNRK